MNTVAIVKGISCRFPLFSPHPALVSESLLQEQDWSAGVDGWGRAKVRP